MTPLGQLVAPVILAVTPSPSVGLSALPTGAVWPSAAVLVALAVRSAARLAADRVPTGPNVPGCSVTSRTGDTVHLVMAAGMVPMVVPLGVPPVVLIALFSTTTAFVAGTWLRRSARQRLARRRGGVAPCRPAHALEPHHVIIGLAMIVMASQMSDGMSAMPGMGAQANPLTVSTLALIYTWTAVVFLGGGLAKAATAQPLPSGRIALLGAPVTVYACELAMTVVMGLMLLG